MITHSRETYQPTSIMRWDRGIFNGSHAATKTLHCWRLWETTLQLFLRMTSSKMSPDLISLSAVVDACARASKQRQAVKFQQIWSDRCHRTTMFELLRFTRRLPNMEKDEKVPAPRGSRWAHGTCAFFVVCFFFGIHSVNQATAGSLFLISEISCFLGPMPMTP